MNTRKAFLVLAATLIGASSVYAEKVPLSAAPKAVQEAIRSRAGRNPIEDIDRDSKPGGQVTYEASWKSSGIQQELLVSEAGTILRDVAGVSNGLSNRNLTLANKTGVAMTDTPQAVQSAVQSQLLGAAVDTVQKGIWNGQTIYEVTYHRNGQLATYQVSETGQPIVGQVPATGWKPKYSGLADANVPLSGGSKMGFTEAPTAVQNTVNQLSNGARVEDFERGTWNGKTVYEAAFKRNGENVELQVLEDGTLVTHAPKAVAATPMPAKPNAVARVGNLRYAGLSEQNVPISGGRKIPINQAPTVVQNAIRQAAAGAPIEDLEQGTWNGKKVFEAAFKRNGETVELQLLENGSIVTKAPSTTATGAPAPGISGTVQR